MSFLVILVILACCRLVSQVQYALRPVLKLEKKMGQTDGRTPDRCIRLPLDVAGITRRRRISGLSLCEAQQHTMEQIAIQRPCKGYIIRTKLPTYY